MVSVGPHRADQHTDNDPAAVDLTDCTMLREGCHRAAALYVAGLKHFELLLWVTPAFDGWMSYDKTPSLRRR